MSTNRIDSLRAQQAQHLQRAKLILDAAERDGRGLTADEEKEHARLLASVEQFDKQLAQITSDDNMLAQVEHLTGGRGHGARGGTSWGQLFIAGVGDYFKNGGHRRGGAWQSPAVEMRATTLTEGGA